MRTARGHSNKEVSIESVLQVLADFEHSGGASGQLVAWELDVDQGSITAAWSQAVDHGLLERCGSDVVDGREEEMWRLTERGQQARADSEPRTG